MERFRAQNLDLPQGSSDREVALVRGHPKDFEFRTWLGKRYAQRGKLAAERMEKKEALAAYRQATTTLEAVLSQEPRQAEAKVQLDFVRKEIKSLGPKLKL
jgi:hypothetical protein